MRAISSLRQLPTSPHRGVNLTAALSAAALVVLLSSSGRAMELPTGWVCFDGITSEPTPPRLDIVSSGTGELVVNIVTPGVLSTAVTEEEKEFRRLEFPGYHRSDEVGYPSLPAVRQLIAVPAGCNVNVSFAAHDSLLYWDSVVYPVPAIVTKYTEEGWEYLVEEFAYEEDAYAAKGRYPAKVAGVDSMGILRGQGVALLTVYPIQFDAADEMMRVLPFITVTVTFSGGSGGISGDLGPFDSIAEEVLLNYEGHGSRGGRAQADTASYRRCESLDDCIEHNTDYLMIVQDSLYASPWVDSLARHRADFNCYNVAIVSDDVLDTPISAEAIHTFIQDLYDYGMAAHMADDRLGYVLLIGDAREHEPNKYIPADYYALNATDHLYACVDGGDLYADLMIGRLCASDVAELEIEVERFVDYELEAVGGAPSWRDTVLLSSGFCAHSDSGNAFLAATSFDAASILLEENGYSVKEIHARDQWPAATCQIQYNLTRPLNVASVNSGRGIVELCSHGWPYGALSFRPDDVDSLANVGEFPFWMSYSCGTGGYDHHDNNPGPPDYTQCLGEALLHQNADTGALCYYGASRATHPTYSMAYLARFTWEGLLSEHKYELGQFLAYGKLKHMSLTGRANEVIIYNLLGDPALNLSLEGHSGYGSAPDFTVYTADLSLTPEHPSVTDTILLSAEIHNASNYDPDDDVQVVFKLCELEEGGGGCVQVGVDTVRPGPWSSDTASVTWIPVVGDLGGRLLRVEIDTLQTELFHDNNSAERLLGLYLNRDGFPYDLGASGGLPPTVVDINGDADLEVLAAARAPGRLVALSSSGEPLWNFSAPGDSVMHGPPAVGDLNFDDSPEVVICYGNSVHALDTDGDPFWSVPYQVKGLESTAILGDLQDQDANGSLEVLIGRAEIYDIAPSKYWLTLISSDGLSVEWDLLFGMDGEYPLAPSPRSAAMADLNRDGLNDVIAAYGFHGPKVAAVDGKTGDEMWSELIVDGPDISAYPCNPIIADIDSVPGAVEVICGAHDLYCFESDGDQRWSLPVRGTLGGLAALDLDADGVVEVVATTYSTRDSTAVDGRGWLYVIDGGVIADSLEISGCCHTSPVVADLDSDGQWEIVFGSWSEYWFGSDWEQLSYLHVLTYDPSGHLEPEEFFGRPLVFYGGRISTPTISDTDRDGSLEIWLVDGQGGVHCVDMGLLGQEGSLSRWPAYQHDERHTGTYETPVSGAYPDSSTVSWWGDYLMTGDVLVDSSSSIVVQPGTTVRVTPHNDDAAGDSLGVDSDLAELIVEGGLLAKGTPRSPTSFVPADGAHGQGSPWRGIRLPKLSSDGELYGCTITDAYVGLDADSADVVVERCTLRNCNPIGIRCYGDTGQSDIHLHKNTLEAGHVGIELWHCAAQVDSNTVLDFLSYGIRIYHDRGSTVEGNTIVDSLNLYYPFSGVYAQASHDTLKIRHNTISNIRTYGIEHEMWASGRDEIRGNHIVGNTGSSCTRGMYFYSSNARVRENTIDHVRTPFWVEIEGGVAPDLGDAGVSDGNNSVYDSKRVQYFVRAIAYEGGTVKAENNYWAGEDPLLQGRFLGPVDYDPWLEDDPNGGREDPEEGPEDAHVVFALRQNHPNPFNPSTVLSFAVPERVHVQLRVYDLSGRLVKTLVDSEKDPGWHEVIWDGTSAQGVSVASGVYFCRFEAGSFVAAKKVVILK